MFESNSQSEVFMALERWYGVNIFIANESINLNSKKWKFTGKFDNQSLENVLNNIGYVKNFDYKIEKKNVIITF